MELDKATDPLAKRRRELSSVSRHFWEIVGFVVLILAIAGIVSLLWGGTPLPASLSVNALLALLGGALAFLAVMIQIETGQKAQEDERVRQRTVLAMAIMHEVEAFGRPLNDLHSILDGPGQTAVRPVKALPSMPFAIYQGNAGRIGNLPQDVGSSVVEFYCLADEFLTTVKDFSAMLETRDAWAQEEARPLVNGARQYMQDLIRMRKGLIRKLHKYAGAEVGGPGLASGSQECASTNNA